MKKIIFLLTLLLVLSPVFAQADKVCAIYFTYLQCNNCKYTDPVVLDEWTKMYNNLVVIEYVYDDWSDENAYLLGLYAQKYGNSPAVPQLIINETEVKLGRLDVPNAENGIASMQSNPCLLLDGSIPFSELDLNQLPAKPKL